MPEIIKHAVVCSSLEALTETHLTSPHCKASKHLPGAQPKHLGLFSSAQPTPVPIPCSVRAAISNSEQCSCLFLVHVFRDVLSNDDRPDM